VGTTFVESFALQALSARVAPFQGRHAHPLVHPTLASYLEDSMSHRVWQAAARLAWFCLAALALSQFGDMVVTTPQEVEALLVSAGGGIHR